MSFGLKVWLLVWSIISALIMFQSLDTNTYKIFSYEQMVNNIFIFAPACSILCGSILVQVLQNIFKRLLIPGCIGFFIHFAVLIIVLPYRVDACILLGLLLVPVGIFHYIISVKFFGNFEG